MSSEAAMEVFFWMTLNPLGGIAWGLACTVLLVVVLILIEVLCASLSS